MNFFAAPTRCPLRGGMAWVGRPHHGLLLSGGPGTVDGECGFNAGGQRPVLRAAEDTGWPHPELHHPPDLPLHL